VLLKRPSTSRSLQSLQTQHSALHGTRTGLQLVNQSFFLSVQVMGVRGKINLWYSKNKAKDSVGFGAPYKEIKYKKKKDKNKRNKTHYGLQMFKAACQILVSKGLCSNKKARQRSQKHLFNM
jgi:hypothetical protein